MRNSVTKAVVAAAVALAAVGGGQTPASAATDKHTMEGTVTKVDAKKGWVDVKTAEGSMKLHFPPPALDGVKAGDSVTIELGMSASPGGAMPKTK
jgi:uncharacterized membrane protein